MKAERLHRSLQAQIILALDFVAVGQRRDNLRIGIGKSASSAGSKEIPTDPAPAHCTDFSPPRPTEAVVMP